MNVFVNKGRNCICFDNFKHVPNMQDTLVYIANSSKDGLHMFDDFRPWEGPELVTMYKLPDGGYTEDVFDDRLIGESAEAIKFIRVWKEGVIKSCTKFGDMEGVFISNDIIKFNKHDI